MADRIYTVYGPYGHGVEVETTDLRRALRAYRSMRRLARRLGAVPPHAAQLHRDGEWVEPGHQVPTLEEVTLLGEQGARRRYERLEGPDGTKVSACRSCDTSSNLPRRFAGCGCAAAAHRAQGGAE